MFRKKRDFIFKSLFKHTFLSKRTSPLKDISSGVILWRYNF
jgi:hypothetical protein